MFIGGLLILIVIAAALWSGFKTITYEQTDNQKHLAEKQRYLEKISALTPIDDRPNFVLILFDDLGYGDLGITGSKAIATPAIDQLAQQGLTFSHYYAPAPACTPSRAGLLSGRLPLRAGMPQVIMPSASPFSIIHKMSGTNLRFPTEEITLADVLQASGYATGMIGKWHLGDEAPSLPNDMGFQQFFGALYSNDMTPFALYRNRDIEIQAPADQTRLNEWYTREATQFVSQHRNEPFFLYFAHNFPHIPLYRPDPDKGRSKGGVYGDVVEGLDDVVAEVVASLKQNGVYENTVILITSDNGPWYQGSPGTDRGRKGVTFEGGMHVPMIAHWPQKFKTSKTITGLSMGTDWFPTILDWLNIPLPSDRIIDGKSLTSMLENDASSPNEYLYYFAGEKLMAVRDKRFKYHGRRKYIYSADGIPFGVPMAKGPWLFDTNTDDNESYDVSENMPHIDDKLRRVFEDKATEMKNNMRGWIE